MLVTKFLMSSWEMENRTASLAATNGAVARVLEITADVANLCVDETLFAKVSTVEVLSAPEATCGHGTALCALRNN
jgi:hypothetical protein